MQTDSLPTASCYRQQKHHVPMAMEMADQMCAKFHGHTQYIPITTFNCLRHFAVYKLVNVTCR